MSFWTYRYRFTHNGATYRVAFPIGLSAMEMTVTRDGQILGRDHVVYEVDGTRNMLVRFALDDGRTMEVECGYVNWWQTAIAVRVDGDLVHESRPGKVIAWPKEFAMAPGVDGAAGERAAALKEQNDRFKRNLPSLLTDLSLGVVFFFVGSHFGLITAAVTGAVAGVVLWVVQKITKIDLLGGLAVFGIVISIISAAFAVIFNDPMMVQMRTTIIGVFVASLFLIDGLVLKGKWLGARIERYLPPGSVPWRVSVGVASLGLFMALANWAVAAYAPQQVWLFYSSFLDVPLAMALGVGVMLWAREPAKKENAPQSS